MKWLGALLGMLLLACLVATAVTKKIELDRAHDSRSPSRDSCTFTMSARDVPATEVLRRLAQSEGLAVAADLPRDQRVSLSVQDACLTSFMRDFCSGTNCTWMRTDSILVVRAWPERSSP
jgi:hypothetical protein